MLFFLANSIEPSRQRGDRSLSNYQGSWRLAERSTSHRFLERNQLDSSNQKFNLLKACCGTANHPLEKYGEVTKKILLSDDTKFRFNNYCSSSGRFDTLPDFYFSIVLRCIIVLEFIFNWFSEKQKSFGSIAIAEAPIIFWEVIEAKTTMFRVCTKQSHTKQSNTKQFGKAWKWTKKQSDTN